MKTTHFIIESFSPLWWKGLLATAAVVFIFLFCGKRLNDKNKKRLATMLGVFMLLLSILIHPYLAMIGAWSIQSSMPLQLCTLSGILAAVVLIWRNQLFFELLLYWGIAGGLQSLLTPELIHGYNTILLFEYYILHGGLILTPLTLIIFFKMQPRKLSWLKVFFITQLLVPPIFIFNWITGSNYMYLNERPLAESPMVIGPWPWYILGFEVLAFIHFLLIYLPFQFFPKTHTNEIPEAVHAAAH